jgi:sodium-coupled monocarboxylate transporter 8/12
LNIIGIRVLKTLSTIDIVVFAGYMVVLFGIGVWFTRRQKNLKTYLLADQNVHWVIVAISVLAALFSGNTYLGAPAETFFHNLVYLWVMVSFVIATPITTLIFLPFFRGLNLITAYEYLELRFDRKLRLLASALFLSRVTLYIATVIYAPALAVTSITELPLWQTVLVTGTTATIYTSLGGMKAVIWTDSLQFLVLCGGIVLIVIFAARAVPGGLLGAWQLAAADGKTRFFNFDLDPTVRITFWSGILGGTAHNLVQLVTDQISVQRYLTAKSLNDAKKALWLKLCLTFPLVIMFYITGTVLYAYYKTAPDDTPAFRNAELVPGLKQPTTSLPGDQLANDQLLPYFVVNHLPTPLPGLLIAALFGATMAVVSAGINSLATAALIDFQTREVQERSSDRSQLLLARCLTFAFGVAGTGLALVIGSLGTLVQISVTVFGIFGGPLLGIFLLGVLVRRANSLGAVVGLIAGTLSAIVVAFPQYFLDASISFLWIGFSAASVTFVVGWIASFGEDPPTPAQQNLVYRRKVSATVS